MIRLKQIMIPILFAIGVSCVQFWVAIRFSLKILWQVTLMQNIVGHGPILGYRNGQPMHEGTPVQVIASYIGFGIGFIVYWLIGSLIIKKWHNIRLQDDALKNGRT
jgi:hypothetical protein